MYSPARWLRDSALLLLLVHPATSQILSPPASYGFGGPDQFLVDVDGDLDLDLIFVNGFKLGVSINNDSGAFNAPRFVALAFTGHLGVADIDGDGDPDAIVMGDQVASGQTLFNVSGLFQPGPVFPGAGLPMGARTDLWFGDFDLDGAMDFLHGSSRYLGVGMGLFLRQPEPGLGPGGVQAVGDFDRDGNLDALSTDTDGTRPVWVSYGSAGGFGMPVKLAYPGVRTVPPQVLDLDQDGEIDVVAAGSSGITVAHGSGSRMFEPFRVYPAPTPLATATAGDLNGDGLTDLVFGRLAAAPLIGRNLGGRTIVPSPASPGLAGQTQGLFLADMDDDGILDIVGGEHSTLVVLLGDGAFRFEERFFPGWPVEALDQGDVDRDGDVDVLGRGQIGSWLTQVYGNALDPALETIGLGTAGTGGKIPQLTASGGLAVRENSSFALRVFNGVGGGSGCLFASTQQASLPYLGGALYLHPPLEIASIFVLGGGQGRAGEGIVQIGLPVPRTVVPLGVDLFFQAAIADVGAYAQVTLTNGIRVRVLP